MPQISRFIRDALKNQLSADATGFNARLATLWPAYQLPQDDLWTIDWSAASVNFLFGRVTAAALAQSSVFQFPFLTIDTLRAAHTNRVKFATFSGQVQGIIDVHYSWSEESVIQDFASSIDAIEDAMVACLNDQNAQFWPPQMPWNGNVVAQKGPLAFGGKNWIQTISFLCNFELNV